MITPHIIILSSIIVGLIILVWNTRIRLKNSKDALIQLDIVVDMQKTELNLYKTAIKSIAAELIEAEGMISQNTFPFEVCSLPYFKKEDVQSIRFKKKDGKVFVYTNGAMVPTESIPYVTNITGLSQAHKSLFKSLYRLNNNCDIITKDMSVAIKGLITYVNTK